MSKPTNKTAIVTGASSGLGWVIAETLARADYAVFGTSRRSDRKGPTGVTMLTCDVTQDDSVTALVSAVLSNASRIDVLVNNAGVGLSGAAEEASIAEVKALYEVNMFGVIRMTNAVLPTMRQQRSGRIVNIGSILGIIPSPYLAHYAATKHAIEGYTESMDHELRGLNIRAVTVEPGVTKSDFEQNTVAARTLLPDYDKGRKGASMAMREMLRKADDPKVVADVVVRAASSGRPSLRYPTGSARQVSFLRGLLPQSVFDRQLHKMMKLPG